MSSGSSAPRYAPWVSLLRDDFGHFRNSTAAAYWSLAPFYVGQFTETACSVASATMVINAARAALNQGSGISPVTQRAVLEAVGSSEWQAGVECDDGDGATLQQLASFLESGASAFLTSPLSTAAVALLEPSADDLRSFRDRLADSERRRGVWVIANYYMECVMGSGDYGHFSPVGAYDFRRDRVLLLDVYRQELEPYWVPTERLFAGMAMPSKTDGEPRGYLVLEIPEP